MKATNANSDYAAIKHKLETTTSLEQLIDIVRSQWKAIDAFSCGDEFVLPIITRIDAYLAASKDVILANEMKNAGELISGYPRLRACSARFYKQKIEGVTSLQGFVDMVQYIPTEILDRDINKKYNTIVCGIIGRQVGFRNFLDAATLLLTLHLHNNSLDCVSRKFSLLIKKSKEPNYKKHIFLSNYKNIISNSKYNKPLLYSFEFISKAVLSGAKYDSGSDWWREQE